ncbi:MAG: cysteine--tRNA ligase [Candidatus Saccharimonadales bacterium]
MKLYNTLTRKVEEFTTLEDKKVKMYTCGVTVYSQPQIGNWVAYIYSDILTRVLQASGYEVTRIQNITDVGHLVSDDDSGEDKMEKGAKKEGLTAWQVADKYIEIADREAFEWLNLKRPTKLIRATDLIAEQIAFVEKLEEKGYTYQIKDGIYFDTSKLSDYGKLARLDIEGLEAGARVDVKGKKNKTDFALWKFSPKDQKRDMQWESPWGIGFPGWHLECSVIAYESLGEQIDLHTGGIDHIPVHHTNEIAQTESVTGKQFSKFWFHNNHIKINGTKLSKSLGNSYTLQDILDKGFSLEAFKLMVLSSSYRTEGNFTWEILEATQNRLNNWQAAADLRWQVSEAGHDEEGDTSPQEEAIINATQQVLLALQNDLDTPFALSVIDEVVNRVEKEELSAESATSFEKMLTEINQLLGVNLLKPDITDEQKQLIKDRETARAVKDWAKSDEIRSQLKAEHLEVRDTPHGPIWSRT